MAKASCQHDECGLFWCYKEASFMSNVSRESQTKVIRLIGSRKGDGILVQIGGVYESIDVAKRSIEGSAANLAKEYSSIRIMEEHTTAFFSTSVKYTPDGQ